MNDEQSLLPDEPLVVITTTENQIDGERLAQQLVAQELAACVQIIPSMVSVYRWQGKVEKANESLLLIKTIRAHYQELVLAIKNLHSYQTPEIIALAATHVSDDYLMWLLNSVKPSPKPPSL